MVKERKAQAPKACTGCSILNREKTEIAGFVYNCFYMLPVHDKNESDGLMK